MGNLSGFTELSLLETQALGKAIVGVPNPDLSMFLPEQQRAIYQQAAHFLEEYAKNGRRDILARVVEYSLPIISWLREHGNIGGYTLIHDLIQNAEPKDRISLLKASGRDEDAREVPNVVLREGTTLYTLDEIIKFSEHAKGEPLNYQEKKEVSIVYLKDGRRGDNLDQVYRAYPEQAFRNILSEQRSTVEEALFSFGNIFASNKKDAELRAAVETFDAVASMLYRTRVQYAQASSAALDAGWEDSAILLLAKAIGKSSKRSSQLRHSLKELVEKFDIMGYTQTAKQAIEYLGGTFNMDSCFERFMEVTTNNFRSIHDMSLLIRTQESVETLLESQPKQLVKYAGKAAKALDGLPHEDQNPYRRFSYKMLADFVAGAYGKLGNKAESERYVALAAQLKTGVTAKAKPQSKAVQAEAAPETSQQKKTLQQMLLEDSAFKSEALEAYQTNGMYGIESTIRSWVIKNFDPSYRHSVYGSQPVDIAHELFKEKGLDIGIGYGKEGDDPSKKQEIDAIRRNVLKYMLAKGSIEMGIGAQIYHAALYGLVPDNGQKTKSPVLRFDNPQEIARAIIANINGSSSGEYTGFEANLVDLEENFLRHVIPDFRFPERVMRASAARTLEHHVQMKVWNNDSHGHWYGALAIYQHIGNDALTLFVRRNLADDERYKLSKQERKAQPAVV